MSKILVTGGAGYIGSVLVRELLKKGYRVRVFDKFYFGRESLKEVENEIEIVEGDIRKFDERILDDISAVVHLAALSNDPTAEYDPEGNMEINYESTKKLSNMAKKKKIRRFIYASSCSIYDRGIVEEKIYSEEDSVNPTALYSFSKYKGEKAVLKLTDENFSPVILRQGTVYGISPRMRYDLVVNTMVKDAILHKKIFVIAGGIMWRPLVDVRDVADCIILLLSIDENKIRGEIFNLLYKNYRIIELAEEIKNSLSENLKIEIEKKEQTGIIRSYRVSGEKIKNLLGFRCKISPSLSAKKMYENIISGKYRDFENPIYYNIEWMKKCFK
jgi:nucleoside-diphosphate-sugar epimerase